MAKRIEQPDPMSGWAVLANWRAGLELGQVIERGGQHWRLTAREWLGYDDHDYEDTDDGKK
jgi:hypothetical protein